VKNIYSFKDTKNESRADKHKSESAENVCKRNNLNFVTFNNLNDVLITIKVANIY